MEAVGSKELDDSLFSTDSHLDWADEAMAEDNDYHALPTYEENVGALSTSPKPIHNGTYHQRRDSGRDARANKGIGQQQQQQQQQQQSGRQSRGSGDYRGRNGGPRTGRGGGRGGRSSSRTRYGATQQTGYSGPPQQASGPSHQTGTLRGRQESRDRSLSMERTGSTERPSGWRRNMGGTYGRTRADQPDRWEHDKFDRQPPSTRGRRNSSANQETSATPIDIERIGKEGISHVTINRKESNASARGAYSGMAASYESPRRMGSAENALRPKSPYLPSVTAPGLHPYRAPHRRMSSVDSQDALSGTQTASTTQDAEPVGGRPAAKQEQQPPSSSPVRDRIDDSVKDVPKESSAESEWENFVANGGLEMPFDRITDDLLKQPRNGHQAPPKSPLLQVDRPAPYASRTAALLSNDQDQENDDASDGADRSGAEQQERPPRGSSKRGSPPIPHHKSKQTERTARAPSKKHQDPAVGIRIKGTSPGTSNGNRPRTDPRPSAPSAPPVPSVPVRPAQTSPVGPRPTTPSKPSGNSSRSSSAEGRSASSSAVPSTYPRRQFESYDEDRGRHIFSVNIAYDDNRFAPIHVHERDDLAKMAAKFARTWRLHNKELRIKQLLGKMKSAVLDASL